MNDFDKFIKIPNEDISNSTHILVEFIVYIKNKDYEQIKVKAHFHGFVHSISDEYNLDLKFLLAEYKMFYDTNLPTENELTLEKKENQTRELFVDEKEKEENKIKNNHYLPIIVGILIGVFIMFLFIFKVEKKEEKKVLSINKEVVDKEVVDKKIEKENIDIKKVEKTITKEEKEYIFDLNKAKILYQVQNEILLIEPFKNNKLWLGLIDLDDKSQIGSILQGQASYKLKSNTLLLTGHGYFNFINKRTNKPIKYRTLRKLFFYYKDGTLYQLKKKDVLALNGGFTW
jgi:hypothetical protein